MSKVSLIIPMYNEERYIKRCIDSLLKQSYKDFEALFIDDGSTDDSAKIVTLVPDKRIKYLYHKHVGSPGILRNFGAKKAKGSILVFIDADMMLHKDYLEELIKPIKGNVFGTFHGVEKVGNLDNVWAKMFSRTRQVNPPEKSGVFRAIRKKDFIKAKGFKSKKGYFDDDLSHYGLSVRADKAICYHNNPETIKEIYNHSVWIGKSFYNNPEILWSYIVKEMKLISFIVAMSGIVIVLNPWYRSIVWLSAGWIIATILTSYMKMYEYKDNDYIHYFIFLNVKIAGLVRGFVWKFL